MHTRLAVRVRPNCPAHNCRRPVGTAPWTGSAVPFGHWSAGGKRWTVSDECSDESSLGSRID